ncbi:hypothetical protein Y032_0004g2034 [Ancylostoma ceylanicum]|uniref:Uncharacterized protein n=1 Tax=Ancylostoma ceylanicum TaxID=53326 RepID=A0A016VUY8_9BILA|nr:hypothetical protein Y032_0004g2034 [Ancylostoma ceylanicum]
MEEERKRDRKRKNYWDKQLRYKRRKEELGEPNRGGHALRQVRKKEKACTNYDRKGNTGKLWGSIIEENMHNYN